MVRLVIFMNNRTMVMTLERLKKIKDTHPDALGALLSRWNSEKIMSPRLFHLSKKFLEEFLWLFPKMCMVCRFELL